MVKKGTGTEQLELYRGQQREQQVQSNERDENLLPSLHNSTFLTTSRESERFRDARTAAINKLSTAHERAERGEQDLDLRIFR